MNQSSTYFGYTLTYVPGQIDVHCGSGSTTGLFSTLLPVLAGIAGTGIGAGVTLYTSRVSDKNSREREAEERQFRHAAEEQSKREERLEELLKQLVCSLLNSLRASGSSANKQRMAS